VFHAVALASLAFPFGGVGSYPVPPQPLPAPSAVSAAAVGRSYGGLAGGTEPLAIRVRGRQVSEVVLEQHADCDSKQIFPVSSIILHDPGKSQVPKFSGGHMSAKGRFELRATGGVDLGDQIAVVNMAVDGRLGARRSAGAVAVDVTIADKATGQQVDHCVAASKWVSTAPERRVYSGASEQAAPVVLELSRSRRSVRAFRFGIFSNCTPDGQIAPTDAITSFRIRRGRFGDDFSDEGDDGSGGTIHLDFSFHGTLNRASARGTLNVTATERDAQGNVVASCPSGQLRWTARQ
jgi:hypothetical protein